MTKNVKIIADSSAKYAEEVSAGVTVDPLTLAKAIGLVPVTPPAVLTKHKVIVKREKKEVAKKEHKNKYPKYSEISDNIALTADPEGMETHEIPSKEEVEPAVKGMLPPEVKKKREEKKQFVEQVVLPEETKNLIEAAFATKKEEPKVVTEVVIPPCPVCHQDYEYVLSGITKAGKTWKKYVHDWHWKNLNEFDDPEQAIKVADVSCDVKETVLETKSVKEMSEEVLKRIQEAREFGPCIQKLTKLFNHAIDKKFIHLYDENYTQIGTAEVDPASSEQIMMTIRTAKEDSIWNIGEAIFGQVSDLFTIGNFVGFVVK